MGMESARAFSVKKELQDTLDRKNTARAFSSALIHVIAIPVFVLIIHFTGLYGSDSGSVKLYMAVFGGLQIIFGIWGYFIISRRELDRRRFYSNFCFFVTTLCMTALSGIDRARTGSWIFYIIAALYAALVPVMTRVTRRIYAVFYAAVNIASVAVAGFSARNIVDVIVLGLAVFIAGEAAQNYVTEYVRTEISLRDKTATSEKDSLTGLMNRRGLNRNAAVLWPYCARASVMAGVIEIDIDFFRKYNDRFGHPAGDRCLKLIAGAIKDSAGCGTDIAARTGGGEFLIFVQGMSEEEVIDLAMKIRCGINDLQLPHAYAGVSNYVTVSMGVACCMPVAGNSFEELCGEADSALYTAKENGRNCVVYGDKIYGRMKRGLAMVISM